MMSMIGSDVVEGAFKKRWFGEFVFAKRVSEVNMMSSMCMCVICLEVFWMRIVEYE